MAFTKDDGVSTSKYVQTEINRQLLLKRANELMKVKLLKQHYILQSEHLLGGALTLSHRNSRTNAYHQFSIQYDSHDHDSLLLRSNPSMMMDHQPFYDSWNESSHYWAAAPGSEPGN
eukprot:scaffold198562_cov47-Attheya_sp.AAC.1